MSFYPKDTVWDRKNTFHRQGWCVLVPKPLTTSRDIISFLPPFHPARHFHVKTCYGRNAFHILNVPYNHRDSVAIDKIEKLLEVWDKIKKPIFDPMYLDYLSKLVFTFKINRWIVENVYGLDSSYNNTGIERAILTTHPETDVRSEEFNALIMRAEMLATTFAE